MKRPIAFLVCLMLLGSLGAVVFADAVRSGDTGNQIITTTVPERSWTMTIPADVTIPYMSVNNLIGTVTIEPDSPDALVWQDGDHIYAYCYTSSGEDALTSGSNKIPFSKDCKFMDGYERVFPPISGITNPLHVSIYEFRDDGRENIPGNVYINIPTQYWASAPSGTYTATLTYGSYFLHQ